MTLKRRIAQLMKDCGVPAHIKGYDYIVTAIELGIKDREIIHRVTKELYPTVAKMHSTTASRVERAIRHATEVTFVNGNINKLLDIFGSTVNPRTAKPTNGCLIATFVDEMRFIIEEEGLTV